MADETPAEPPPADGGHLAMTTILDLMNKGMGRALACKEAGFGNYRSFTRLMAENEDFRERVLLIERSRLDLAELNIYSAMVNRGEAEPDLSAAYLQLRWKVRAMNEARRAKKRAEAIEDRKLALEERKAEGSKADDDAPLDLSALDPEERALFVAVMRKLAGGDDPDAA